MALAALALRVAPAQPAKPQRRLVPAVDDADAKLLDQAFKAHQRALIASLWPAPTHQCVAAPVYAQFPAPAVLGFALRVSWAAEAQSAAPCLRRRLPSEARDALAA